MNYVPNKLSDLIGRNEDILKIKSWLNNFYNPESEQKNALFIEGPSGIGKSILIQYILEDLLYDIYRVDGCVFKNIKTFRDHCDNIMHTKNILMMMDKGIKKVIFIDELESIVTTDKMILSELNSLINENNVKKRGRSKKKKIVRNSNPIICVCHPIKNKKIKELMNDCDVITLNRVPDFQIYNLIRGIMDKEKREIEDSQIYDIIGKSYGDFRKIFEIVQNILLSENKVIKENDINNFNKKELDLSLNNILETLYYRKGLSQDDISYYFDIDKVNIPLMYYENLLNYYECIKKDDLESLDKIYSLFSQSNVIESYIFNEQKWQLNNFFCSISVGEPRNIINQIENRKNPKNFFIKFTIVLSKTSLRYYNIKILKNIADKMGIYIDEFYDIISYFISLLEKENYSHLSYLLNLYHLVITDLEKMIKLYYSDSELSINIKNGLKKIIL